MFSNPAKARHAAKVALALVIVYGLTLQWGWINPYWAGFAVIFCSLTTQGESLNKSGLRIAGTFIGTLACLAIMAAFGQDRWLLMLACCFYLSCMVYLMTGRRLNYMWQTSAFVALAIMPSFSSDTYDIFLVAMARMQETLLGCLIWALIDMLIWPVTNLDKLKNTAMKLTSVQCQLLNICAASTAGRVPVRGPEFAKLRGEQQQLLAALNAALQAAGSESYEVRAHRQDWNALSSDFQELMTEIDQWQSCLPELQDVDVNSLLPDFDEYLDGLQKPLRMAEQVWQGVHAEPVTAVIKPSVKKSALDHLGHFDSAALLVAMRHLECIAALANRLSMASLKINDLSNGAQPAAVRNLPVSGLAVMVPDLDRIRAMLFITLLVCVSFVTWVLVDPPGHAKIWTVTAIFGTVAVMMPFVNVGTILFKVFAVVLPAGALIHIFVMPALSGFLELGLLVFAAIFAVQYWLNNPLGIMLGSVGFLQMAGIENSQSYSFIGVAIGYLFILFSLLMLIVCSYFLGSPRPEKKMLSLLRRYFTSAGFVLQAAVDPKGGQGSFILKWRIAFHQAELASLPQKMMQWSSQIDYEKYPANSAEEVKNLIAQLDKLHYRLFTLLSMRSVSHGPVVTAALSGQIRGWRLAIGSSFTDFSQASFHASAEQLMQSVKRRMEGLEESLSQLMDSEVGGDLSESELINAYELLGAYRGVSVAGLDWLKQAEQMNMRQWREECFS